MENPELERKETLEGNADSLKHENTPPVAGQAENTESTKTLLSDRSDRSDAADRSDKSYTSYTTYPSEAAGKPADNATSPKGGVKTVATSTKVGEKTSESSELSSSENTKKKWPALKIVVAAVVLALIWFAAVQIMAAERYAAVLQVIEAENQVGVNPTADKLDFGDLSRGTGSTRYVTLKNDGKSAKKIVVIKYGEIMDLVEISQTNFTLKPGEEVQLEFKVKVPESAPYKKYTGKVIIFKWPKLF